MPMSKRPHAKVGSVLLTRYTHSCVRVDADGRVLVIDPGVWCETEALARCDAILVTHEHGDHLDMGRLAGLDAPVFLPAEARVEEPADLTLVRVQSGQAFEAAGFGVVAVGGRHAAVYGDEPSCANLGYVLDEGRLYHPGDALFVPDADIAMLLVPLQGSWLKTSEALDFVNAVAPRRSVGIHDGQVNERGLGGLNRWMTRETDAAYQWMQPGTSTSI
jgi:L-ascorbate metabolism protein UlaG (beta-lactamase superfamily)